jgi:hypothetical protein
MAPISLSDAQLDAVRIFGSSAQARLPGVGLGIVLPVETVRARAHVPVSSVQETGGFTA